MHPSILLHSGRYFDFTQPEASGFSIGDIAHALARMCRFTGHCHYFYSVAQHSVLVSRILPPRLQLAGLLHDAHEAFVGDVAAPLKMLLPDYRELEKRVEKAVLARFGFNEPLPIEVKDADLRLLYTEKRDLMPIATPDWPMPPGITPLDYRIAPEQPAIAEKRFLARFQELQIMGSY